MKKALLFLFAALLLTACEKEPTVTPLPVTTAPTESVETTAPTETTLPAETTVPTVETTVPTVETTAATEPEGAHVHSYTQTLIPATCTAPGTTAFFCQCGDNFTEGMTPPQGHSFGDWVVVRTPTETEAGLEQRTCSLCGEIEENYYN